MSLSSLPEGCIANVLSFTTPQDACRLSLVSFMFKSAVEYDAVWERFLPEDYQSIISKSNNPLLLESVSSKKELYLSLCDNPILIDGGKKSFSLEKKSGKKCFMIPARELGIAWGGTPAYWGWRSDPASRFAEVGELLWVCWLDIRGKINTNVLSPATWYTTYIVFKLTEENYGLHSPAEVTVGIVDGESCGREVFWATKGQRSRNFRWYRRLIGSLNFNEVAGIGGNDGHDPKEREDGWLEVELGDFFNKEGEDRDLESRVLDTTGHGKRGLIVEGIEIRPKKGI